MEEDLKEQIEELKDQIEELGQELDMLRSECAECENELYWSKVDCKALEEELSKNGSEVLRMKQRYEDMPILWVDVYDFLQQNRDRLNPVEVEELLKANFGK